MSGEKLGHQIKTQEIFVYTPKARFATDFDET